MNPPNKIHFTDAQLDWLVKHYPNTENAELCFRLGCSESTLHRLARRFGLKKTRAYMRRTQKEAAAAAGYFAKKYGRRPPQVPPGGNAGSFKKGVTPLQRLGMIGERMRVQKSAATRRKTFQREKARVALGLPQLTRLRLGSPVERPGVTAKQRWYLRSLGYRVDGFTAYYDASTARSQRIETKYKAFKFTAI